VGTTLATVNADIIELSAFGGRAPELADLASRHGFALPAFGRIAAPATELPLSAAAPPRPELVLSIRPDRWLMLSTPETASSGSSVFSAAAAARAWSVAAAGIGTAVDLSAGLSALLLDGPATCDVLIRGCRLDLDPSLFPVGHAAATHMVQVSVILTALPAGMLLLTPSTTARHVREWLAATAQPFGFAERPRLALADLSGLDLLSTPDPASKNDPR
jgi:sarcosine oxidase subunit gamma